MDGDRSNSSVRVEIEHGASVGGATVPEPPGRSRSRLPLVGGFLALIVSLGLVAVALPDRDDPLPGGPELASDATTTTTTSTTEAPTTTIELGSSLQTTDLAVPIISVVPAGRGWIALEESGSAGPPQLHRSLDGVSWTAIDTVGEFEVAGNLVLAYSDLVVADDGFALLRTTTNPGTSSENSTLRIDRLVSEFGVEWTVDTAFPPIERTGVRMQPIAHAASWVHVVAWSDQLLSENSLVATLLRENVIDPGILPEAVCWAFDAGTRIEVIDCQDGPSVSIAMEDLRVPDDFSRIGQCVSALDASSGRFMTGFEFTTIGPAGSRTLDDVAQIIAVPSVLDDGTVVLVDGGTELLDISVCGDLVPDPGRRGASVIVWPPAAEEAIRLPIELDELPTNFFGRTRAAAATGTGIRVLVGSDVWEVAPDLSAVTLVYESTLSTSADAVVLTDDGDAFVRRVRSTVELVDVATGEQRVLTDSFESRGWIEPLALFDQHFFVSANGNLLVLELGDP